MKRENSLFVRMFIGAGFLAVFLLAPSQVWGQFTGNVSYNPETKEATISFGSEKGKRVTEVVLWCKNDKGVSSTVVIKRDGLSDGATSKTVGVPEGIRNCTRIQITFEPGGGSPFASPTLEFTIQTPEGVKEPPPIEPVKPTGLSEKDPLDCSSYGDPKSLKLFCYRLSQAGSAESLPPNLEAFCKDSKTLFTPGKPSYVYACVNARCVVEPSYSEVPCEKDETCINGACVPKPPAKKKASIETGKMKEFVASIDTEGIKDVSMILSGAIVFDVYCETSRGGPCSGVACSGSQDTASCSGPLSKGDKMVAVVETDKEQVAVSAFYTKNGEPSTLEGVARLVSESLREAAQALYDRLEAGLFEIVPIGGVKSQPSGGVIESIQNYFGGESGVVPIQQAKPTQGTQSFLQMLQSGQTQFPSLMQLLGR